MTTFGASWVRSVSVALASAVALATVIGLSPSLAQPPDDGDNPGLGQGIDPLPPPPPKGAWGEVIMANSKWLVVQNHQGQQFPIAVDSINQFLIRWPTQANALTGASVVEAIGHDIGSNTLRTDHIDVFEGSDRNLVSATFQSLLPNNRAVTTVDPTFNRFMNSFDIGSQNLLYGWAYPVQPAGAAGFAGGSLHAVGPVIDGDPIRLSVPGNNVVTVLPDEGGNLSITQLTRGNPSFAEKGDLAFLVPTELSPRSVILSQLVLYKKVPLRQFRLP